MTNFLQGIYEVKNKDKYIGKSNPKYRSSYELEVFTFMDTNEHILQWGSEVTVVKYFNPVKKRIARYFVDITVKYRNAKGEIIRELIEIKPFKETLKPKNSKGKKRSSAIYETATYIQNRAKWEAAAQFANTHGMRFKVISERQIFI